MSTKPRKRVESAAEAAEFLGVSRPRVQQFAKESPWWRDEFRTSQGYDVVAIALAQAAHNRAAATATTTTTESEQVVADAEAREAVESAWIKTLERRKRQRVEATEGRKLISAVIVERLFSECLSELHGQLAELPYRFSQQVPADLTGLVHTEDESRPALLQMMVADVISGFGAYLDMISDEIFEVDDEADLLGEES